MPDRIADEKKVVALMIRMYCRRHCRQQGHNGKTDQINRTDLSSQNIQNIKTDQINQANKTGRIGDTNHTDQISRTDMANQLIRTDQFNQTGRTSQFSQTDRNTDTNQNANSSQTGQTGNSDQFNQADRTGDTNQADNSSRTDTRPLCPECAALLDYAHRRLDSCRFGNGKPSCRKCPVHCYRADMRERIRTVMRWAGPRMIFRHPIAATRHLLRELRSPEPPK